jgi:hypothetical protein
LFWFGWCGGASPSALLRFAAADPWLGPPRSVLFYMYLPQYSRRQS